MFNRNQEIKRAMKNIPRWAVAEKMSIHENTLYRLLRRELSEQEEEVILDAVNEIQKEMLEVH